MSTLCHVFLFSRSCLLFLHPASQPECPERGCWTCGSYDQRQAECPDSRDTRSGHLGDGNDADRIGNRENVALFMAKITEDFSDLKPGPDGETVMIDSSEVEQETAMEAEAEGPDEETVVADSGDRIRQLALAIAQALASAPILTPGVIRVCRTVEYIGRWIM